MSENSEGNMQEPAEGAPEVKPKGQSSNETGESGESGNDEPKATEGSGNDDSSKAKTEAGEEKKPESGHDVEIQQNHYGHIFNQYGGSYEKQKNELSHPEEEVSINRTAFQSETDLILDQNSMLMEYGILAIHCKEDTVASFYTDCLRRTVIDMDKGYKMRYMNVGQDKRVQEPVRLHDYEKCFLNFDEKDDPQLLLIIDRNDYEAGETPVFFKSMIDAGHEAPHFKKRLKRNKHLIIYQFGGEGALDIYQDHIHKWKFAPVWDIPFFPNILHIKYKTKDDPMSTFISRIEKQRKCNKWPGSDKAFLREISLALSTNRLPEILDEKDHDNYQLPQWNEKVVEVKDLIEEHPLNPYVLLLSAYFGNLNLDNFNELLKLLLEAYDEKIPNKKHAAHKNLVSKWYRDGDTIIRDCGLESKVENGTLSRLKFSESETQSRLFDYFEKHHTFFQLEQAKLLINNAQYWFRDDFADESIRNLALWAKRFAGNNQIELIRLFVRAATIRMEEVFQQYRLCVESINSIQKYTDQVKNKLEERTQYQDFAREITKLGADLNIPKADIKDFYDHIIAELSKDGTVERYRSVLQESYENAHAKKEKYLNERDGTRKRYGLIIFRVVSYLQVLVDNTVLKSHILDTLKNEITYGGEGIGNEYSVNIFNIIVRLYDGNEGDCLDIIRQFLRSDRQFLRAQSFQALTSLVRLNVDILEEVHTWRPSPDVGMMGMKEVSWSENSAAVLIFMTLFEDFSYDSFNSEGEYRVFIELNYDVYSNKNKWGTSDIPLVLFQHLQIESEDWSKNLKNWLDWLFHPQVPAASLRHEQKGYYTARNYRDQQELIFNHISWMVNGWAQVLLGDSPDQAPKRNVEIVNYILAYIAQHNSSTVSKRMRFYLGRQPSVYSDKVIQSKSEKKEFKKYVRQRDFVRSLIKKYDELRSQEQLVLES